MATGKTLGQVASGTLREDWDKAFRSWKDLLPRRVKFGPEGSGRWSFQLENDEQKRAAGWEPAHSFQPGPDGDFVRVDHLAPPQALCSAAWVLADMARRLADRGAQLRVDGSRRLREFEHALRFSGGISRNPLLLWEDGLKDIVDDVLAAHEGHELMVAPATVSAPVGRKPLNDLHRTLWEELLRKGGTHGCRAGELVVRGLTGRRLTRRLSDLRDHGHAELLLGGKMWRAIGRGPRS